MICCMTFLWVLLAKALVVALLHVVQLGYPEAMLLSDGAYTPAPIWCCSQD